MIQDMSHLCRLCAELRPDVKDIFFDEDLSDIPKKLEKLFTFKVTIGDGLPQVVCHLCYNQLDVCYSFMEMCHLSQEKLIKLCFMDECNENEEQCKTSQLECALKDDNTLPEEAYGNSSYLKNSFPDSDDLLGNTLETGFWSHESSDRSSLSGDFKTGAHDSRSNLPMFSTPPASYSSCDTGFIPCTINSNLQCPNASILGHDRDTFHNSQVAATNVVVPPCSLLQTVPSQSTPKILLTFQHYIPTGETTTGETPNTRAKKTGETPNTSCSTSSASLVSYCFSNGTFPPHKGTQNKFEFRKEKSEKPKSEASSTGVKDSLQELASAEQQDHSARNKSSSLVSYWFAAGKFPPTKRVKDRFKNTDGKSEQPKKKTSPLSRDISATEKPHDSQGHAFFEVSADEVRSSPSDSTQSASDQASGVVCNTKTSEQRTEQPAENLINDGPLFERQMKCGVCGTILPIVTSAENDLREHSEHVHRGLMTFQCLICSKKRCSFSAMQTHTSLHFITVKCEICTKIVRRRGYAKHLATHDKNRSFTCDMCGITLLNKKNFLLHCKVHTGEAVPSFMCEICSKSFLTKGKLTMHQTTHSDERSHSCDICGLRYPTRSRLQNHKLTHDSRKQQCSECKKWIKMSNKSLRNHMAIHLNERKYKCSFCPSAFNHLGIWKKHEMFHFDERPHKCNFCSKAFRSSFGLKVHTRIHTGERPHECETCHKTFVDKANFKKHKKQVGHL